MTSDTIVLVYGSETPLGNALIQRLEAIDEINATPRASDYFSDDIVTGIHRDISRKKPAVVVNCMIDPDTGYYPYEAASRYVAPSHAALQQCRRVGSRYIFCSSCMVHSHADEIEGRKGYSDYDPWIAGGSDPWTSVLQTVESSLFQQTSAYNLQAKYETHAKFECYCIRFGHLLFTQELSRRPVDAYTLGRAVREVFNGRQNLSVEYPHQMISPIDLDSAVDVLVELCGRRPRPTSGTYNIGPAEPVSMDQFMAYLSLKSLVPICLGSTCNEAPDCLQVYGVDANRGLSTELWQSRGRTKLPTWRQVADKIVEIEGISV